MSGKDLGTYHVRVEYKDGRAYYMEWKTGGRFTGGGRGGWSPVESQWQPPLYEDEDDLLHAIRYMFEEGNYSCDCNRSLFHKHAYWQGEEDDEERPCGEKIRLRSLDVIRPDGTTLRLLEEEEER